MKVARLTHRTIVWADQSRPDVEQLRRCLVGDLRVVGSIPGMYAAGDARRRFRHAARKAILAVRYGGHVDLQLAGAQLMLLALDCTGGESTSVLTPVCQQAAIAYLRLRENDRLPIAIAIRNELLGWRIDRNDKRLLLLRSWLQENGYDSEGSGVGDFSRIEQLFNACINSLITLDLIDREQANAWWGELFLDLALLAGEPDTTALTQFLETVSFLAYNSARNNFYGLEQA